MLFNTSFPWRNRSRAPPGRLRCCEHAAALFNVSGRRIKFLSPSIWRSNLSLPLSLFLFPPSLETFHLLPSKPARVQWHGRIRRIFVSSYNFQLQLIPISWLLNVLNTCIKLGNYLVSLCRLCYIFVLLFNLSDNSIKKKIFFNTLDIILPFSNRYWYRIEFLVENVVSLYKIFLWSLKWNIFCFIFIFNWKLFSYCISVT